MTKEKIEAILVEYGVPFTDALSDRLNEEYEIETLIYMGAIKGLTQIIERYLDVIEELKGRSEKETLEQLREKMKEEAEYAYADFTQYKIDILGADLEDVDEDLPYDGYHYGLERAIELINECLYDIQRKGATE